MKKILFYFTLFLFIIAGTGSTVLVLTGISSIDASFWYFPCCVGADWNSVTSGESFAGLGILLFLIGAGIGAVIVLLIVLLLSRFKKQSLPAAITTVKDKDQSASPKSYNIQINAITEGKSFNVAGSSNTALFYRIALNVKHVFHKVSTSMKKWTNDHHASHVFSPTQKSWEKNIQSLESVSAATPRIYVLPPESLIEHPSSVDMAKRARLRSRSDISSALKIMGPPDVTILDIKQLPENGKEDLDSQHSSSLGSHASDLNPDESEEKDFHLKMKAKGPVPDLPKLSIIDNQLGDFVSSLSNAESSGSVTYMLSIMIEEVLPRPDSGLLQRMLRMSEIPIGMVEGSGEPILYLHVGSEYHLSIGLIQLDQPSDHQSAPFRLSGPHTITLKPLDGDELSLNMSCEKVDDVEHVGSAFWDMKQHSSPSLNQTTTMNTTIESSTSTVLTPIEMSLGFCVYRDDDEEDKSNVIVKKTFMSCLRSDLSSIPAQDRLVHEDRVVEFVLSKMELISMPSMLMFLRFDDICDPTNNNNQD